MARPNGEERGGTTATSIVPAAASGRLTTGRSAPFVGAVAYAEDDAQFFFGRVDEIDAVAAKLRSRRLTVLYGPSGAGRTSLLLAGVVPRLRAAAREAQEGRPSAICVLSTWEGDARRNVEAAAREVLQPLAGDEPLRAPAATLAETLLAWTEQSGTLLLVLDRFEQHLLRHDDREDGTLTGFSAELVRLVRARPARVHLLLSVREDAWRELDRFEGQIPPGLVEYVRLEHLRHDTAAEAIEAAVFAWDRMLPLGADPYYVEAALSDDVLAFAPAPGDGVETAFVQLLLERLWQDTVAAGARALTVSRLDALGRERIVEQHVAAALARLSKRERTTASACFRFLVTGSSPCVPQRAADLAEWTRRPPAQVAALLERLCTGEGGRLLRAVADDQGRWYELFHDVLADPIAAWRGQRDRDRHERRRRVTRVGAAALAAVALSAAAAAWAIGSWSSANRHYHAAQRTERVLKAQIAQLTAAQRAAAAEAGAARKLARLNDAIRAQTASLEQARRRLDAQIASLRTDNHRLVFAIRRFNAWNAALAKSITALDSAYATVATQVAQAQEQKGVLQNAAGTLTAEAAAQAAELATLTAQNAALARKAATLGYAPPPIQPTPKPAVKKPAHAKPTTAPSFAIAADVSQHDPIRHYVDVLGQQLSALAAEGRPADRLRLLREEHSLLEQQRDALTKENAQLTATRVALAARHDTLKRTRDEAAAEHKTLVQEAARDTARNRKGADQVTTLQKANAALEAKTARQIAALATTQHALAAARAANTALVSTLETRVESLTQASIASTADPQLAGLLALEAYRLTPYDADDTAHPAVYNALWLALKQLDEATATKLVAPATRSTTKIGTARSAVLAKALCAHIDRPLSSSEWQRYLPAGAPYSASAADPCA